MIVYKKLHTKDSNLTHIFCDFCGIIAMMNAIKGANITEKQKETLIEYITKNKNVVTGKFSSTYTHKSNMENWIDLANILNSIPGANKDWKNWRKTWQDMRSRTKRKLSSEKMYMGGTGGGPFVDNSLTKTEEDIMKLIKVVSVDGHPILESEVQFDFANKENQTEPGNVIEGTKNKIEDVIPRPILCENFADAVSCEPSISTPKNSFKPKRTIPKRNSSKLLHTKIAVNAYELLLNKKMDIKKDYYEKKLILMGRMVEAEEESARAIIKMSDALEKVANSLEEIVG